MGGSLSLISANLPVGWSLQRGFRNADASLFSCSSQDLSCQCRFLADWLLLSPKSMKTLSYCTQCRSWIRSGKTEACVSPMPLLLLVRTVGDVGTCRADACDGQEEYTKFLLGWGFEVTLSAPKVCWEGQQVLVVWCIQKYWQTEANLYYCFLTAFSAMGEIPNFSLCKLADQELAAASLSGL